MMNSQESIRNLIHRQIRSLFAWHRIEKLKAEGNGYDIVVLVQPNSHEYSAAADLTAALKRHYREVHLNKCYSFYTISHTHLYSISITCRGPKLVGLPMNPLKAA